MLSRCLCISQTIARSIRFHQISPVGRFLRPKLKQNCVATIGPGRLFCTTKDGKGEQKGDVQEPPEDSIISPHATQQHHPTDTPKHPAHDAKPEVKKGEGLHKVNLGNVASTITFTQQAYEELEKTLMDKFHEKSQSRFRAFLLGTILLIGWISLVFGTRLRKYFTEQTAGLAKETLENESLKIQTQELATAVVQTILEDKDITSHAATFLKEASTAPETQQALLKLTMHILQHKDTMDEVTKIAQKLIKNLANDKVLHAWHRVCMIGAIMWYSGPLRFCRKTVCFPFENIVYLCTTVCIRTRTQLYFFAGHDRGTGAVIREGAGGPGTARSHDRAGGRALPGQGGVQGGVRPRCQLGWRGEGHQGTDLLICPIMY